MVPYHSSPQLVPEIREYLSKAVLKWVVCVHVFVPLCVCVGVNVCKSKEKGGKMSCCKRLLEISANASCGAIYINGYD